MLLWSYDVTESTVTEWTYKYKSHCKKKEGILDSSFKLGNDWNRENSDLFLLSVEVQILKPGQTKTRRGWAPPGTTSFFEIVWNYSLMRWAKYEWLCCIEWQCLTQFWLFCHLKPLRSKSSFCFWVFAKNVNCFSCCQLNWFFLWPLIAKILENKVIKRKKWCLLAEGRVGVTTCDNLDPRELKAGDLIPLILLSTNPLLHKSFCSSCNKLRRFYRQTSYSSC